MAMTSKAKKPEVVVDNTAVNYYKEHGNEFVEEGKTTIGYRYDQVEGRKLRKPDGKEFTNNVTLSQMSSEVLVLLKDGSDWYIVMGKQARSPYIVEVDGKLYAKTFLEQAAGLLEEGQSFEDEAIAESEQELGTKLIYLQELIAPRLCRHVSYTDEVSKLYLAVTERVGEQKLDANENINVDVIPLDKAKEEFEAYLSGEKETFFGFDIPDITMLSMAVFFWYLDTGKIDLDTLV